MHKGLPVILSFVVLLSAPALADYIAPGEVLVQTKAYVPQSMKFSDEIVRYAISWQGISVADAKISTEREVSAAKPMLHVRANVKTSRGIDFLYKLRHQSDSYFEEGTFRPSTFQVRDRENSRVRLTQISFEGETIKSRRWKNGKEEANLEFVSHNHTFDPMSAAFLARSLPISLGQAVEFDVFNGKHRYLISFMVEAREKMKRGDTMVDAFRVVPTIKKLTDSKEDKRLKSAAIWISADERRDILRLESKLWLGKIVAVLEEVLPAGSDRVRGPALQAKVGNDDSDDPES